MIRQSLGALVLAACLSAAVGTARADAPEPYQLVRALELLQDDVATGGNAARAGQREMLLQVGNQFLKVEPELWKSQRNLRAAVVFLLSGGAPSVVRKVIDIKEASDVDRALVLGALAYVSGREQEARTRLKSIDPMTLGPVLGGNVSLAMGSLVMRDDPALAIRMFGLARLLLPGSLIEEAALRRLAFLHFEADDIGAFATVGSQYLRRFGKSAYSSQFRERLDLAVRRLARSADPSVVEKLAPLFEDSEAGRDFAVLLLLAREGLVHGRTAMARAAAKRAQQFRAADEVEIARLQLYAGFVDVMSSDALAGRARVASVKDKVESTEDRWLADAGLRLADRITLWPPAGGEPSPTPPVQNDDVLEKAVSALKASKDLLARADQ